MNELVKRIRSSVQSVVENRRRKSSLPRDSAKRESAPASLPEPTVHELPQPEPPQLTSLTKQRARGPQRRRPPSRQALAPSDVTTVDDDDPARFAWGRDPSIDPALFFSDVMARSMPGSRINGMTIAGSKASLASIAEDDREASPSYDNSDAENPAYTIESIYLRDECPIDSTEEDSRPQGGGEGSNGDADSWGIRVSAACSDNVSQDESVKQAGPGFGGSDSQLVPSEDADSSDVQPVTEDVAGDADFLPGSERRQSGILHLTGGKVEGTPRRLCSLL